MAKNKKRTKKQLSWHMHVLHHVISTFVPRAHNKYRPHIISRYGLAAIVLIGVGGIFLAARQQHMAVLGVEPKISPAELLQDVNVERVKNGDPTLTYNAKLAAAALAKGNNMFADQYWAHNSPSGVTPWQWIQGQDYAYLHAGENLAKNYPSAEATVAAWMASPTHRENMLHGYYTEVGFAVVNGNLDGNNTTIVVALFATPAKSFASVAAATTDVSDVNSGVSLLTRAGISAQSMNPAALGAVLLSLLAIVVAAITFAVSHLGIGKNTVRNKKAKRISWYQHHAVIKAVGLTAFVVVSLVLFSGGQL